MELGADLLVVGAAEGARKAPAGALDLAAYQPVEATLELAPRGGVAAQQGADEIAVVAGGVGRVRAVDHRCLRADTEQRAYQRRRLW